MYSENADVGVIIGRFQVPYLHQGHMDLIDHVSELHKKVVIILGISRTNNTVNDPLDWESRKDMIAEWYPRAIIVGIQDQGSDQLWSQKVDDLIETLVSPTQSVMLYGGRDSFIKSYHGRHATTELFQDYHQSGTEIRDDARKATRPTEDFRTGVIWASANRFPTVFTTVDIAIFNLDRSKMLFGKKAMDTGLRLVGGFADVESVSFEQDAYREVMEETSCAILYPLQYCGSFTIDDWRYRKEPDVIKSLLFWGITDGKGTAGDDLDEIFWVDTETVRNRLSEIIEPHHQPLVRAALTAIKPIAVPA